MLLLRCSRHLNGLGDDIQLFCIARIAIMGVDLELILPNHNMIASQSFETRGKRYAER